MNLTVPNHGAPDSGMFEFTITLTKDSRAGKRTLTHKQKKRRHNKNDNMLQIFHM